MNRTFGKRVLRPALAALVLLTAGMARAQEAEAPPATAQWHAERTQLEELIAAKVRAEVAKAVNPRRVAEAANFPWPVKEPTASLAEMKAAIDKRAAEAVDAKFPAAKEATFKTEGEGKFKLLTVGDEIEFTLRGGRGVNAHVKGKIVRIATDRIEVGSRWIAMRDMDEDVLALLLPAANAKAVEEYVQREVRRYRVQRDNLFADTQERIAPQMMAESGYVHLKGAKPGKMDATAWQPMKALFDAEIERQTAAAAAAARKTVEPEVYQANHYVFFEKEWLPESVMQSILAQRAEGAAPAPAPTPAPPPGMPPNVPPGSGGPFPIGMPPGMMPTPTPPPAPAKPPATPTPPVSAPVTPPANPNPTVPRPQVPDTVDPGTFF